MISPQRFSLGLSMTSNRNLTRSRPSPVISRMSRDSWEWSMRSSIRGGLRAAAGVGAACAALEELLGGGYLVVRPDAGRLLVFFFGFVGAWEDVGGAD